MILKVLTVLFTFFIAIEIVHCTCGTHSLGRGKREANDNNSTEFPQEYIIGGRFANPGEFPWQVFLKIYYNWNTYSFTSCGGVIWNSNFILTASHCLLQCNNNYFKKPVRVELCVGDYNIHRRDGERCMPAWRWWTHSGFNPCNGKFGNDIALIKIRESLRIPTLTNNGYGSLNIACHPYEGISAREATLSGWGRYNTRIRQGTNVLKMVNLPVWTTDECKRQWDVNESQICAGGVAGENSCMGDSGGPLVTYIEKKAYVIGLSSYGPNPCAQKGVPNVFTKVAYFLEWINNTVKWNS